MLAMLGSLKKVEEGTARNTQRLTFLLWVLTAGSFLLRGPGRGGAGLLRQRLLLTDWICSFLWSFMVMGEW